MCAWLDISRNEEKNQSTVHHEKAISSKTSRIKPFRTHQNWNVNVHICCGCLKWTPHLKSRAGISLLVRAIVAQHEISSSTEFRADGIISFKWFIYIHQHNTLGLSLTLVLGPLDVITLIMWVANYSWKYCIFWQLLGYFVYVNLLNNWEHVYLILLPVTSLSKHLRDWDMTRFRRPKCAQNVWKKPEVRESSTFPLARVIFIFPSWLIRIQCDKDKAWVWRLAAGALTHTYTVTHTHTHTVPGLCWIF